MVGDALRGRISTSDEQELRGLVTGSDGYYLFSLNFSSSSDCPDPGDYYIQVTPPASGYLAPPSVAIPPRFAVRYM